MDQRLEQLKVWLNDTGINYDDIAPASADASFRRYFRIKNGDQSLIVMDAPPEKEDSQSFVQIANMLLEQGLNVPKILQQDLNQGFLLLNDLGNTVFLSELNPDSVDALYAAAMKPLLVMQSGKSPQLPLYDEQLLQQELNLFSDWYLNKHLAIVLSETQKITLDKIFQLLISNALEQPQVCVHRDYHSRNLMINNENAEQPGVIDFQDAVIGAVTYDLVSLLKDCYISWPRSKIETWVKEYHSQATSLGIINDVNFSTFLRWFDLMGLQRHLKVAGIFSRLNYRDGKSDYLKDIPCTMDYIFDVLERYPELSPLKTLLREIL